MADLVWTAILVGVFLGAANDNSLSRAGLGVVGILLGLAQGLWLKR